MNEHSVTALAGALLTEGSRLQLADDFVPRHRLSLGVHQDGDAPTRAGVSKRRMVARVTLSRAPMID
jgi:hypothetical protein